MMMRATGSALALACLLSVAATAQPPRTLGPYDPERGYEWIAASLVLNADGLVNEEQVLPSRLREALTFQIEHSAADHDFEEGEVPLPASCAKSMNYVHYPPSEIAGGLFDTVLLLSESVVTATLEEAVPGFTATGNPVVLFKLSDVIRLRSDSRVVDYVLVPFDRLVVYGRVFCAINPNHGWWTNTEHPALGDRVVIVGSPGHDRVVRMHTWRYTGAIAVVQGDEPLEWNFSVLAGTGPGTMTDLQGRIGEAVTDGLFDATSGLVSQDVGSPERRRFGRLWLKLNENGCQVHAMETRDGQPEFSTTCSDGIDP